MKISEFALFENLPARDVGRLAGRVRELAFAQGDTIITRGSRIDCVYFIRSGRVKESTCTRSGKEIVFNMYSKGGSFGLVCALNVNKSSADFVASSDVEAFAIPVAEFSQLMLHNAVFSKNLLAEFLGVVTRFTEKLYEMRALDVSERTRAEILRHITGAANTASGSNFVAIEDLPTHEEIANTIFTHREAVTREISFLKKAGVVVATGRNHLSANVGQLQKMVREYC